MTGEREDKIAQVKELMQREILSARRAGRVNPPQPVAKSGQLDRELGASMWVLNTQWQLGTPTVRSSRRIIGPLLNLLRKIGYWATRPYLLALASNQTQFNSHVTQVFNRMVPALEKLRDQVQAEAELVADLQARLAEQQVIISEQHTVIEAMSQRIAALEAERIQEEVDAKALDRQYLEMQMRYRGEMSAIRQHQERYLRYFKKGTNVLDVGCGRGEFLSLLKEAGIGAYGVDLNPEMVKLAQEQGLAVQEADAVEHLQSLPESSLDGIFASHLTEHLPVVKLNQFLEESYRTLKPGAALVFETPNVASPVVLTMTYYRDWTHCPPIHPDTVRMLVELAGFQVVEVLYSAPLGDRPALLSPVDEATPGGATLSENFRILNRLVFGHQNYAVVAVKPE
ncbi:MAG: methyltransferase domain-containing protein [Bacillota bacterium]